MEPIPAIMSRMRDQQRSLSSQRSALSDFAGPTRREANGGGAPESDLVTPESFVHGRPLAPRLREGRSGFKHISSFPSAGVGISHLRARITSRN